ncbi:alpha-D-ribose 1-methylphosphonate 5-triphosphate diphosphatase [Bordetella flabilis]|uniref:Alpha-D-ribose 1-methylphosphonate 5-triphosphate diphosphatase n=1 Tax=Bordetella flabilis TaxID=463014 RepID=A0A193GJ90_9BORD|nr:alpha-D-ribose 1-methylphosphonate 5-triphosphate diphosphatase [Bordetella flabilis]ANN79339.1 alpha-D-ribose 1-methylphosphonate 5-triphosphate diphosphatase [Bordetella flabilis]
MHSNTSPSPFLPGVTGRRVLTADGLRPARLAFDQGRIAAVQPGDARADHGFDAGDMLVLPGIVDLHGDAFERAIMPRPGVTFPYDGALLDVDRQLLANGITTEFHGVTLSWEGGLRGEPYAVRMFDALTRMQELLGARHCVHLRFETHHVAGVELAQSWIRAGKVGFLALNDHLPSMAKRLGDDRKLLQYAERAECDLDTFQGRIRAAMQSADAVAGAMRDLTECARAAGLEVASHDDRDAATRRYYHQLGCRVAEFPLTQEAAQVARSLADAIVFGAPNVVRGGSHTNAPDATAMIRAGLCDILASDYYYPAPLAAVIKLAEQGVLPLHQAWNLVSRNPARAAGLADRGALDAGMVADAIVVDDSVAGVPRVCAAIVDGQLRYAARHFDHRVERAAA